MIVVAGALTNVSMASAWKGRSSMGKSQKHSSSIVIGIGIGIGIGKSMKASEGGRTGARKKDQDQDHQPRIGIDTMNEALTVDTTPQRVVIEGLECAERLKPSLQM